MFFTMMWLRSNAQLHPTHPRTRSNEQHTPISYAHTGALCLLVCAPSMRLIRTVPTLSPAQQPYPAMGGGGERPSRFEGEDVGGSAMEVCVCVGVGGWVSISCVWVR